MRAGVLNNPASYSRYVVVALFTSMVLSIILVLVGIIFNIFWLYCIIALPFVVWFYPRVNYSIQTEDRKSTYNVELAYFLSYLRIVHSGGVMIYSAMTSLVGKNIFPAVERDGVILQKWVEYDDYVQLDAVSNLAADHPNETFKTFLQSYYSIAQSSIHGLQSFIDNSADAEFEKIVNKDEKMISKISGVFIMGAMMMIMVPLIMMFMSFVGTDDGTIRLMSSVLLFLPIIYAILVLMMFRTSTTDVLVYSRYSLLIGVPIFGIGVIIGADMLAILSLSIAIPLLINGRIISSQISYIKSLNNHFPIFLRDLIERRKVDSNFIISLKHIINHNKTQNRYGAFGDILSLVEYRLSASHFDELIYDDSIKSWRLRMLLFVFQKIFDNGNSSIHTLENMYDFATKTNNIKNKISDSIQLSSIILYVSPAMFFVVLVGVSVFLTTFNVNVPEIPSGMEASVDVLKFFAKPDFANILESMKPVVFLMSLCSGIVISRVTYMSFAATYPVGICMITSFVILIGWDYFFDVLSLMMMSIQ